MEGAGDHPRGLRRSPPRGDSALLRGSRRLRLLLDTHVLLWSSVDGLGDEARDLIERGAASVHVSAASIWEIEIKRATGRLEAPDDPASMVRKSGFLPVPMTFEHAVEAGRLPMLHGDPFDRMLIAQARIEGMTLATADATMGRYDVRTLQVAPG